MTFEVVTTRLALRERRCRARGPVGLVPTMGNLHAGHLSLVKRAADYCDMIIVTIFVNPTQFGPTEDFDAYPRTVDEDVAALQELRLHEHLDVVVFTPSRAELCPGAHAARVATESCRVAVPTESIEGALRPFLFDAIATIVLRLLNLAQADHAFFGEKDAFQCALVIRMVEDLDVPTTIHTCPTVRAADGLALSSRNSYLTPAELGAAVTLIDALRSATAVCREWLERVSGPIKAADVVETVLSNAVLSFDEVASEQLPDVRRCLQYAEVLRRRGGCLGWRAPSPPEDVDSETITLAAERDEIFPSGQHALAAMAGRWVLCGAAFFNERRVVDAVYW